MSKPNILWYCTDQQRFDTLSYAGNKIQQAKKLHDQLQTAVSHRVQEEINIAIADIDNRWQQLSGTD